MLRIPGAISTFVQHKLVSVGMDGTDVSTEIFFGEKKTFTFPLSFTGITQKITAPFALIIALAHGFSF